MKRRTNYYYFVLILIVLFCISAGYAVLNKTLSINGNTEVKQNTWDLHFENIQVRNESVNADSLPIIDNSTKTSVSFNVDLNVPGEFYEFTVDVVNAGTLDAMIDSIVKTPELTDSQKKYLDYIIEYQNGEQIVTKHMIPKGDFVRIKVRVEYKKDLTVSDLPTVTEALNLGFVLNYLQGDSTGIVVKNNGVIGANGDINEIGTIVTIGTEQFYTIGVEGDNVKLFSMYNLYVGNVVTWSDMTYYNEVSNVALENPTGIQSYKAIAANDDSLKWVGVVDFSTSDYWSSTTNNKIVYVYSNQSLLFPYIQNYSNYIKNLGCDVQQARLISIEELIGLGCSANMGVCTDAPNWVLNTSYWTGTSYNVENYVWIVGEANHFLPSHYNNDVWQDYKFYFGIRPVLLVPISYFNK